MKIDENISRFYQELFHFYQKKNLKKWNYNPENHKKIYGLYHIYCVNDWKALIYEQISALKDSGLYDETETLFVSCIVNKDEDIDYIQNIVGRDKCMIISNEYNEKKYEFPALDFIHDLSRKKDFLVYYFHTKGISRSKANKKEQKNVTAWRKMMEYFIFYKYKVAINVLNDYDTYGACLREYQSTTFYDGNFWWSKSSYIKLLPMIEEENKGNRYWAEHWLCLKATKRFSAFNTKIGLTAVNLPEFIYNPNCKLQLTIFLKFTLCHYANSFYWHFKLFRNALSRK